MDFATETHEHRWPANGTGQEVVWTFRHMKHGEKQSFLRAQQKIAKLGDDADPADFLDIVSGTIAKLVQGVEGLPEEWPEDGAARLDFLARVSQPRLNEMFTFVTSECAGLSMEAQGK